ncbi:MAG: OadG family protein [Eubacteriales bacterium]|nr:OadG family protein [Eubacteriales bacterium]
MKIKRLLLLLTVFVFAFSMTACSSGQAEVDFDYTDMNILSTSMFLTLNLITVDEATKVVINNTEGQEVYQTALSNFEAADNECGKFKGFITKDNTVVTFEEIQQKASEDENFLENILLNLSSSVEEDGATVKATLQIAFEDRDAEACFVYISDPAQTTVDQTTNKVTTPFQLSELTISPQYSLGEKMGKAAMNTLMGMGTVFVILIFIALIIGQFEKLSNIIMKVSTAIANVIAEIKANRAKKKSNIEEEETAVSESPVAPVASGDLMNDSQLVAVITAAIMAMQSENGTAGSDGLIVRSIRKAKR